MEKVSEEQIVARLQDGACFSAEIDSGAFQLRVKRYVPVLATAIHDGHRVVEPFAERMQVNEAERYFEEDPHTGTIAGTMDISLTVLNSRYCCDLNRSEERCVYDEAWGKQVWKEPLDSGERQRLLQSHHSYYRVLDVLLSELTRRFGSALLFDLHSYNYRRIEGSPPLFNIGSHHIDMARFGPVVEHLLGRLNSITLPDCENRAVLDEVFAGKGYQAEFVHQRHPDVLCVPLELKKVFMDEQEFTIQKEIYDPLFSGTSRALKENGEFFMESAEAEHSKRREDARN